MPVAGWVHQRLRGSNSIKLHISLTSDISATLGIYFVYLETTYEYTSRSHLLTDYLGFDLRFSVSSDLLIPTRR